MEKINLDLDKSLQAIDISDTPIKELYLASDFPIFSVFRFSFLFPFTVFVCLITFSVFLPKSDYIQIIEDKISDSTSYAVRNTISLIAPIYRHVFSSFYLKNLNSEQIKGVNITGNLKVLCYKESAVVHQFSGKVSSRKLTEPIFLFSSTIINFDKIVTNFNFTTQHKLDNLQSTVITTTQSTTSTLFILFVRILLSLFIFYYLFGDLNPFISQKDHSKTLEQISTYFLLLAAFFYANPLEIINLKYPTQFLMTISIFFRDFFFSYLIFYILSLFTFFTRNPQDNPFVSLALPYGCMIISLLLFWINDAQIYSHICTQILPETSFQFDTSNPIYEKFDDLSIFHLVFFAILFVLSIYSIVSSGIVVSKTEIEHQQRWLFYTSTTVVLILFLSFYVVLKIFFGHWLNNTVYDQCYILLVSLCYVIVMEGGHEEIDYEKKDIYEKQQENGGQFMQLGDDDNNQLDVEDDPELLAKQEMKKKLRKEMDLATAAELNQKGNINNNIEDL